MQTLLDINTILLESLQELTEQGKGGPITPAPGPDGKPDAERQQPTKEYVE
jgi:hypothetical protein